jgi:diketogulonate reductase-like aldo/keto reductase
MTKLQVFQLAGLASLSLGAILLQRQTPAGASNGIGPQIPPSGLRPAKIPQLGLGTFAISNRSTAESAVSTAFASGIRHVDTAMIYRNEEAIGAGIQHGLATNNLKREDIWVTTKLWNTNHQNPEVGLQESLRKLNLSYVDLYLMHFPAGQNGQGGKAAFDHVEVSTQSDWKPA